MSDNKDKKVEETKTETPPPSKLSKLDAVKNHLAKCKEFQLGNELIKGDPEKGTQDVLRPRFAGQPGFNPFLYIAQIIDPIENKINSGTITEDELDGALKIPVETKPDGNAVKVVSMSLSQYIKLATEQKKTGIGVVKI